MSDVLYYPAFYPSNPLVDSRIRGLPDFLFGAPPPVAWGNPFMVRVRQPPPPPPPTPASPVLSLPTTATPEPYTPEEMTPVTPDHYSTPPLVSSPLVGTPPPLTSTLLDDDIMRIKGAIVKKKNLFGVLLDILPNRSYEHRTKFIARYHEIYRGNLLEDLFTLTKPHNYYFAIRATLELYRVTRLHSLFIAMEGKATHRFLSLEGLGTDEEALAEILFMATNGQIHYCQNNWSSYYRGYELESQLEDETSGSFARLLVALSKGERDETGSIDMNQVNIDVVELYNTGENRTENLLHTFTRRSHEHIRLMMEQFQKQYKTDLLTFIMNLYRKPGGQLKGDDFVNSMRTFLQAVKDEIRFYALRLHDCVEFLTHGSIKDLPIDIVSSRHTIVRIIITQHEFDLAEIKEKYSELSGIQLEVSVSEVFKESKFTPLRQLLLAFLKEQEIVLMPEVQQIYAAVNKKGRTSNVIFSLLSSSDYERRQQIVRQFNIHYKLNLLAKVEEYMKPGEQLFTMRALIESHESTNLRSLWIAMEGKKTGKLFAKETVEVDEAALLEILFLASNKEMIYFHENYQRVTGQNLVEHIKKANSSGKFSNLLLRLLEGKRWEQSHTDQDLVKHDSSLLYQLSNSEKPDEEIIELFSQRSIEHLKILFRDYEQIYEKEVVDLLVATFKNKRQLLTALLSCVTAVENREKFYAIRLQSCLDFVRERNGNTPDSISHKQSILRIMLTHVNIDLDTIKATFSGLSKDNQTLDQAIQSTIREVELLKVMNNILEDLTLD